MGQKSSSFSATASGTKSSNESSITAKTGKTSKKHSTSSTTSSTSHHRHTRKTTSSKTSSGVSRTAHGVVTSTDSSSSSNSPTAVTVKKPSSTVGTSDTHVPLATAAVASSTSSAAAASNTSGLTTHNRSTSLSPGATAAAAVVPVLAVVVLLILLLFWFRRRRQRHAPGVVTSPRSRDSSPRSGAGRYGSSGQSSPTLVDTEKLDKDIEFELTSIDRPSAVVTATGVSGARRHVGYPPPTKDISGYHQTTTSTQNMSPKPALSPLKAPFTSSLPTRRDPSSTVLLPPVLPELDTGHFFNTPDAAPRPDPFDQKDSDPFDDPRPGNTPSPFQRLAEQPLGINTTYAPYRPWQPAPGFTSINTPLSTPTRPGVSRVSTLAGPMTPAESDAFSMLSGTEEEDGGVEYAKAEVAQVVGGGPGKSRASVIDMRGQGGSPTL